MLSESLNLLEPITSETIARLIDWIERANPTRCQTSLDRRVTKLLEEIGEIAQAFLSVTSSNERGKSWNDVREEAADVLIVAVDIALTPLDDGVDRKRLVHYVQDHLHRVNMGFHEMLWRISRLNATFGSSYRDAASAQQYSAEMVRYAFALNCLLSDSERLCAEVRRKIKKWKRKQPT